MIVRYVQYREIRVKIFGKVGVVQLRHHGEQRFAKILCIKSMHTPLI